MEYDFRFWDLGYSLLITIQTCHNRQHKCGEVWVPTTITTPSANKTSVHKSWTKLLNTIQEKLSLTSATTAGLRTRQDKQLKSRKGPKTTSSLTFSFGYLRHSTSTTQGKTKEEQPRWLSKTLAWYLSRNST